MITLCQVCNICHYISVFLLLSPKPSNRKLGFSPSLGWLLGGGGGRAQGHVGSRLIPTLVSLCARALTRLQVIICKSSPASALLDSFPDELPSNKSWITKILCFVSGAKEEKNMHIERQVSAKGKELDWWGSAFITSGKKIVPVKEANCNI